MNSWYNIHIHPQSVLFPEEKQGFLKSTIQATFAQGCTYIHCSIHIVHIIIDIQMYKVPVFHFVLIMLTQTPTHRFGNHPWQLLATSTRTVAARTIT